jgi:drug/metabolite transporter (DMT)-like permease
MNRPHDPRWAYVLVNLSTLLWSTNFALGRLLRSEIGPFTLTAARYVIASLIFAVLIRHAPAEDRRPGRHLPLLIGMGVAGVFLFGFLLYSGLARTTASSAALINGTSPLTIGLLAALLLGERFTRRMAAGGLISFAGVAVIVSGGSLAALGRQELNPGNLLVLAAIVTWGVYSTLSRVVTRSRSALSATAWSSWAGLPLLLLAACLEWPTHPPHLTLPVILAVIYIGVGPSVIAMLAWNEAVRRVGPGKVTAFYNMLPVYGALLGVLVLGEPFGPAQLVGGGLIIAGSLVSTWGDFRPAVR